MRRIKSDDLYRIPSSSKIERYIKKILFFKAKMNFYAWFGPELRNAYFITLILNYTLKLDCSPDYQTHFLINVSRSLVTYPEATFTLLVFYACFQSILVLTFAPNNAYQSIL